MGTRSTIHFIRKRGEKLFVLEFVMEAQNDR